jgi:hypothetical protein
MSAQQYLTISGGDWPLSASPNPSLGYFFQGPSQSNVATLDVGPSHSGHTIAVAAQQGSPGHQVYGDITVTCATRPASGI